MKRLLIVEDDVWFGEYLVRTLEPTYAVTHVTNPLDAISALDTGGYDGILLDVMLPVANAFTLLQELQSHSDLAKLPVVVCTTIARDMDVGMLAPYGVVALLDKTTMQPADLTAALGAHV